MVEKCLILVLLHLELERKIAVVYYLDIDPWAFGCFIRFARHGLLVYSSYVSLLVLTFGKHNKMQFKT